jgi:hypothetical protein
MATLTITYDGRNSTMRRLIEAMLLLGAKVEQGVWKWVPSKKT